MYKGKCFAIISSLLSSGFVFGVLGYSDIFLGSFRGSGSQELNLGQQQGQHPHHCTMVLASSLPLCKTSHLRKDYPKPPGLQLYSLGQKAGQCLQDPSGSPPNHSSAPACVPHLCSRSRPLSLSVWWTPGSSHTWRSGSSFCARAGRNMRGSLFSGTGN